jgi:hypothetical protein
MLTISKPLSAGQAKAYHKEEFANAQGNYYTEGDHIRGEWHGKLAEQWGLRGDVQEEHFARLADGKHPLTGEQLVRHQAVLEYVNERGSGRLSHRNQLGIAKGSSHHRRRASWTLPWSPTTCFAACRRHRASETPRHPILSPVSSA